jgi:hypothetical protein
MAGPSLVLPRWALAVAVVFGVCLAIGDIAAGDRGLWHVAGALGFVVACAVLCYMFLAVFLCVPWPRATARQPAPMSQRIRNAYAMQTGQSHDQDQLPGSSWGIHCHEEGCVEALSLSRTTRIVPSHEDDYEHLMPALDQAAVSLGWRICQSVWWCPAHTVAKLLACADCLSPCPECSCMGGPRGEALAGMLER